MTLINNPDPELKNNLMAFGREHEDGWNRLVDELFGELEKLPEEIHLLQVKEKYGGLRCYISGTEEAQRIVDWYESLSEHVCEHCGEFYTAKNRVAHGWYKTLCTKCAIELKWRDDED